MLVYNKVSTPLQISLVFKPLNKVVLKTTHFYKNAGQKPVLKCDKSNYKQEK